MRFLPSACLLCLFAAPSAFAQTPPPGFDPVAELLARRVAALRAQAEQLDAQVSQLREKMPRLEAEIERLTAELGAMQPPENEKEEPPPPPAAAPRQVEYRPPLLREATDKGTPIAVVCENGRAYVLDLEEQNAALERLLENPDSARAFVESGGGRLPAGDYEIEMSVIVLPGEGVLLTQEAHLDPGARGEDIVQGFPRLEARLRECDPETEVIQFMVFPDSFDAFRSVRAHVWERGFGVNWIPNSHGEKISIGAGGPSVQ